MDLKTKIGSKVKYLDENGYDRDREWAQHMGLKKGEVYTVRFVDIGSWSSSVWLDEIEGASFNTVMFKNVEENR